METKLREPIKQPVYISKKDPDENEFTELYKYEEED